MDASSLFRIQRVLGVSAGERIEASAVHTLEKKQLLALALSPAAPADASSQSQSQSQSQSSSKGQGQAGHALLLRTLEEDGRARFWRLRVCSSAKQQRRGGSERLVALEFSPEGDWLATLSSRKNRLHLVPVLALVARQRRELLAATYRPAHNLELLGVRQSVMNVQMASYLRATNELGGMNGARYHSQVAGDDEQMSTLEFAVGMGNVTCLRWWRSFNGKNYCLVGGSESLVSIVNVEENAEECRCELASAGVIESIDLLRENFRRETRTSMLVKARGEDNAVRYYRVVLEKKFQPPPPQKGGAGKAAEKKRRSEHETSNDEEKPSGGKLSTFALFAAATVAANAGKRSSKFVVKTFPEHFLQDLDFRPQRIKKNMPHVQLYAINGILSSESSLALYDCSEQKVSLYSNFHWSLKGVYEVPSLLPSETKSNYEPESSNDPENGDPTIVNAFQAPDTTTGDGMLDVELTYCSSDLMLLQGKNPETNANVSTWVSLPSHQSLDDSIATAHIVHYLSLHGNEKVERVIQSTARSGIRGGGRSTSPAPNDSEVIYILQTSHNVYECRPQWSRVALFRALCARSLALPSALSIGYALGIDMASLCQVAANTLYNSVVESKASPDAALLSWMRDLFEVSRALPSTSIRQLTGIGGAKYAIEYAKHVLEKDPRDFMFDESERSRVAYLLIDQLLQPQVDIDDDPDDNLDGDRDREQQLESFLTTNNDYDTAEVVDLCLEHQRVDIAIVIGITRNDVSMTLGKISAAALPAFVSPGSVGQLVTAGHSMLLGTPATRLIFQALPLESQVQILLAHPPSILQQRDWVTRTIPAISIDLCRQLALAITPDRKANKSIDKDDGDNYERKGEGSKTASEPTILHEAIASLASLAGAGTYLVGIAASEFILPSPEEHVELFLTLLLRINSGNDRPGEVGASDDLYSQVNLDLLMKEFADRYRPPVMIARCIDYKNWSAAACIYEAHGELVEALECRLNAKRALQAVSQPTNPVASPTATPASPSQKKSTGSRRRRQFSIESDVLGAEEVEHQENMRKELLGLLDSLVVQNHSRPEGNDRDSSERLRAAILARLLVKWVESGLGRSEVEVYLVSPSVFPHVAPLLAAIFFSDVVTSVVGCDFFEDAGDREHALATEFDDRDREWVDKCHALDFSGQFIFRVCMTFLERGEAKRYSVAAPLPAAINPQDSSNSASPTLKLLDLIKENIVSNDISQTAVRIGPHSAQSLGKSDPLETHVKVFTCGHVFPKRVFEDEVVPEFDKRMSSLPLSLLSTKQLFMREYRRSVVEAPCPVCSFNRVSEAVYTHLAQEARNVAEDCPKSYSVSQQRTKRHGNPPLYFLHHSSSDRTAFSASSTMARNNGTAPARHHEPWGWREPVVDHSKRTPSTSKASASKSLNKAP